MKKENCTFYTRRELAARLGVHPVTIAEWEKCGCPFVYIGKLMNGKGSRPRYELEKVKAWLENRAAGCGNDTQKGGEA